MFSDFYGNGETVHRLREMIARERFPHAVVLEGAQGSGKYTLALMLAQALNCLVSTKTDGLPDFCGKCANCVRIAQGADLDSRFAEAIEARENLRDADKKETRIFVQTHPDVLIIPPDPPQMMIKVDQIRRVIETIYYRPAEGRERVYIFTDSAFMKEAANSLLKLLEEPPEFATIFLLTEIPGSCCPRSARGRCSSRWRRCRWRRLKNISPRTAQSGKRRSGRWWPACQRVRWGAPAISILRVTLWHATTR